MWFTGIVTSGPFLPPWGIYVPSNVTGSISWDANGNPSADAVVMPSVEVSNNATTGSAATFTVSLAVVDPTGATVASTSGSGSVSNGQTIVWSPSSPISIPKAKLWHLVSLPNKPALYTLVTTLSAGSAVVDAVNTTFGIRQTAWKADTGFWLNGVNTKILGTANHQDFAAVGVAVPDHLQWHRVSKLKEMGVNGWRTAHNPPTPALLDAMDELGMVRVAGENDRRVRDMIGVELVMCLMAVS